MGRVSLDGVTAVHRRAPFCIDGADSGGALHGRQAGAGGALKVGRMARDCVVGREQQRDQAALCVWRRGMYKQRRVGGGQKEELLENVDRRVCTHARLRMHRECATVDGAAQKQLQRVGN